MRAYLDGFDCVFDLEDASFRRERVHAAVILGAEKGTDNHKQRQ